MVKVRLTYVAGSEEEQAVLDVLFDTKKIQP